MDTLVWVLIVAVAAGAITAAAVLRYRRRPAPPPLSRESADRTMVGLPGGPLLGDRTVVDADAPPRDDRTVVDAAQVGARDERTVLDAAATGPRADDRTVVDAARRAAADERGAVEAGAADPAAGEAAPTLAFETAREDTARTVVRRPEPSSPRARLVLTGGKAFQLLDRTYAVGRSSSSDIVLEDPSVSGRHARLAPVGDGYALSDLGSTNGTFVDGRRVEGEVVLRGGETVAFGDQKVRFERA